MEGFDSVFRVWEDIRVGVGTLIGQFGQLALDRALPRPFLMGLRGLSDHRLDGAIPGNSGTRNSEKWPRNLTCQREGHKSSHFFQK